MIIKKILAISIMTLAVLSSFSAVSAGLFDFLGGNDNVIDGQLSDSYLTWNKSVEYAPNDIELTSVSVTGIDYYVNGTIEIKLNDSDDSQLMNALKENGTISNCDLNVSGDDFYKHDIHVSARDGSFDYDLNGDNLKIFVDHEDFVYAARIPEGDSGVLTLEGGNITVLENGSNNPAGYLLF